MVQRPLPHHPCRLARQAALQNFSCFDCDERFKTLIAGMEMPWRMIRVIHADDDAEEQRDNRHRLIPTGLLRRHPGP
jgi:hypothetical protein